MWVLEFGVQGFRLPSMHPKPETSHRKWFMSHEGPQCGAYVAVLCMCCAWRFIGNSDHILITGLITPLITPLNDLIGVTPIISWVKTPLISS